MKRGFIVLIPVFLILLSYKMVFLFGGYTFEQNEVVDFLKDESSLGEGFIEKEINHLNDVKNIMIGIDIFFYLVFALLMILVTLFIINKHNFNKELMWGGMATIVLTGLFFFFIWINFEFVFETFHKLIFSPGSWSFDSQSKLINLFPKDFFVLFVKKMISLSVFLGVFFGSVGAIFEYFKPKRYRKQAKSLNKS